MSELKQRIVEILRQSQLASLATVSGEGKPWVRYIFCLGQEDMSIRFATFVNSRKVTQIKNNPEVHLTCGISDPADMRPYLQIQGRAACHTDRAERHAFWKDSLKVYFKGPNDPNFGIVVVTAYRIELCTPGSLTPEVWEPYPSDALLL